MGKGVLLAQGMASQSGIQTHFRTFNVRGLVTFQDISVCVGAHDCLLGSLRPWVPSLLIETFLLPLPLISLP